MKVESSKTNQAAERKVSSQNKNVGQTNVLLNKNDLTNSAPPPSKSFAQILEETRNQNGEDEGFPINRKSDRARESADSDEAKNEKETSRDVLTRDAVEERERKESDERQSDDGESGSGFGAFVFQADNKIYNSNSIPAARSILHVADLERIVSAIRAQNLKNEQAIIISLKHSVLEGLQIKLTIEENGKLKAEFLAASEQIKNQLDARKDELTSIIRERGINLSEMSVRQGSDFSQNSETDENSLAEKNISSPDAAELSPGKISEEPDSEPNTHISYRV